MKKPREFGWEHHPETDVLPEHYSCPFGIVFRNDKGKWEAWTLNSAYRDIPSAELLSVETLACVSVFPQYARNRIQKIARQRLRKLAMKATA